MNTTFTDQTTIIVSAWLNPVNDAVYEAIGDGTNAPTTAAEVRTNIGLGTIATQAASAVAITGGTITGTAITGNITGNASGTAASITGVNPVATGGTGLSTTTAYSPVISGTTATGAFQASLGPGTSGQVLTSAGAGTLPTWSTPAAGVASGTVQATTSGTSINFTSVEAGRKMIVIGFASVSLNAATELIVQIGDSGGIETSGYVGTSSLTIPPASVAAINSTVGIPIYTDDAVRSLSGTLTLMLVDPATNLWTFSGTFKSATTITVVSSGAKALSGALDRFTITTPGGTATFDAGSINYLAF